MKTKNVFVVGQGSIGKRHIKNLLELKQKVIVFSYRRSEGKDYELIEGVKYVNTIEEGKLSVNIYDLSGRMVNMLVNDNVNVGTHKVDWDGTNLYGQLAPTGVYFLQVVSGNNRHIQKIALVK